MTIIELTKKEKDYLKDLSSKNLDNEIVKVQLEKEKELVNNYYNIKIKEEITKNPKKYIPKIKLSKRAVLQMKLNALLVSDIFKRPMEICGVCFGKKDENTLEVEGFEPYHNQNIDQAKYEVSGEGRLKTCLELKEEDKNYLFEAHSHNIMNIFHSPQDDKNLEELVRFSPSYRICDIDGLKIPIPYAFNGVFSHYTGKWEKGKPVNEPHLEAAIRIPFFIKNRIKYKDIVKFKVNNIEYMDTEGLKVGEIDKTRQKILKRTNVYSKAA